MTVFNHFFIIWIDVFDKRFSKKISNALTFSESEQITSDASLSKVTSVIADDYIICLINAKLFLELNLLLFTDDSSLCV